MKRVVALLAAAALSVTLVSCSAGRTDGPISAGVPRSSSSSSSSSSSRSSSVPTAEVTDTVRWINATYAILTKANEWNLNTFGGLKPTGITTPRVQQMLSEWWEVTDRQSADENLEWLLTEGHRDAYKQIVKSNGLDTLTRAEFDAAVATLSKDDQIFFTMVMDSYEKFGENALDAWDLSRAVQCLSSYYVAGYYTEQEALDKSLEICKTIQETFTSWDDFAQSYLYGYQFWCEDDITDLQSDSYARQKVYEAVKALPDSPYQIPWDTELVKTW